MFNKYNILLFSTFFFTFLFSDDTRITYRVDGYVNLEDNDDNSDVTVSFYNLLDDPPTLIDTAVSGADGAYQIDIEPGFYLIEWTKDGYVPQELGSFPLAEDTTLDDVTLVPGEVLTVDGSQSGNWTTSYQYWVTSDISVPDGQTLTIAEGVVVKFYEGTTLTVNGTLEVNGTEDSRVLFTSKRLKSFSSNP